MRMLKEPTRRIRFLTREEARRLLAELPEHMADMAAFSLATGLRRANVTGLLWTQVDLVRRLAWIHPDQAKARKAIAVPLNAEAVVLIRKQIGKHPTHVFCFQGQAGETGQHEDLVQGSQASRYRGLPLARSAAYLGELARAAGHPVARVAGARWMGECGDGAAVRAPDCRSSGAVRRSPMFFGSSGERIRRHVYGTGLENREGLHLCKPLSYWRARRDSNSLPLGS